MYDLKNLKKLKNLEANATDAIKAFWAFDKAAMAAGAIPAKYKELMAVSVALTTQCPYCIDIHSKRAREAGASEQEISETVAVAAALRAGAGSHTAPMRSRAPLPGPDQPPNPTRVRSAPNLASPRKPRRR